MEKVAIASTASKDAVKRLIYELDMAQDDLSEASDNINKDFEDLREDQRIDVDESDISEINTGGLVISVTRDILNHIKGTRLEALFIGQWDKSLLRDGNVRAFLDINTKCFRVVVDYLNESKIAPPECSPEMLYLGEEDNTFLQQLMLEFGLGDDDIFQLDRFYKKHKLGKTFQKKNVGKEIE